MVILPITREAVFSQSQQPCTDAPHSVVPSVRLDFVRGNGNNGHGAEPRKRHCREKWSAVQPIAL
jgi:hypothetical protein